jgi:hypothetical protein
VGLAIVVAATALARRPATAAALDVADYTDEAKLAAVLWAQSPEVIDARTVASTAASELHRVGDERRRSSVSRAR